MTDVRSAPAPAFAPRTEASTGGAGSRRNLTEFIIVLVVLLVAAVVVMVVLFTGDDETSGPLYVLPSADASMTVADPSVTSPVDLTGTAESFASAGRLFGVPDGAGHVDLRSIVGYADSPLAGQQWIPWDSPWGPAFRLDGEYVAVAYERLEPDSDDPSGWSGVGWSVATSADNTAHADDLIGGTDYRGGSSIIYAGTYELDTIAVFGELGDAELHSTELTMSAADGTEFDVETTTSSSPLFDAATFAARVEPVDVNGHDGWIVTDETGRVEVRWSPVDSRVVTVTASDDASVEATVAAARTLEQVDETDWRAATNLP